MYKYEEMICNELTNKFRTILTKDGFSVKEINEAVSEIEEIQDFEARIKYLYSYRFMQPYVNKIMKKLGLTGPSF